MAGASGLLACCPMMLSKLPRVQPWAARVGSLIWGATFADLLSYSVPLNHSATDKLLRKRWGIAFYSVWFYFFGAKWRDEDGTFHLCSGQISSLTTWPMHISSGCRPRSTYIPSTRNMLDIVLGAQAWGDVAEVHLFGDYLNLHGHSIAARGERRAREGKGRHKRTWNQWRGEKRKRR